jgi:hypothetical protein
MRKSPIAATGRATIPILRHGITTPAYPWRRRGQRIAGARQWGVFIPCGPASCCQERPGLVACGARSSRGSCGSRAYTRESHTARSKTTSSAGYPRYGSCGGSELACFGPFRSGQSCPGRGRAFLEGPVSARPNIRMLSFYDVGRHNVIM